MARPRRGRALRGREPRRPLDRRPRRLRQHQLLRHQRDVRRRPPARGRAVPAHLHRRGLRLGRGRARSRETDPLEPRSPYSASKAGSDLIALSYHHDLRPAGRRHPLHRTTSGRTSSPRRSSRCSSPTCSTGKQGAALRRRPQRARLAATSTTTAPASTSCCARASVGEIYNIGAGNEITNRELTDKLLALLGTATRSHRVRRGPPRPRPPLLGRHRQGRARSAGRRQRTLDEALDGHRRVVPRQPLVVGAAARPGRERPSMRVLVTGAGGQVGRELRRRCSSRRRHEVHRRRPRRRSTSPTATRCSARSPSIRPDVDRAPRGLDRGRRLRDRARPRVSRSTRSAPATSPTAARRVGAHVVYVSTDYVFDGTKPDALRRVGHAQPAVGVRPLEARRRARGSTRRRPIVRTSWVCGYHGGNMVKTILRLAGRARHARASSTTSAATRPSPPTWPPMLRRLGVDRAPGHVPRHQPGRGQLVRVRPGRCSRPPGTTPSGSSRSPPPSSIRPARRPGPANSVLDNAALRASGFGELPDFREPLAEVVAALGAG